MNGFHKKNYGMLFERAELKDTPVLDRPTLSSGDRGEYVELLQTQLKQLMFYDGNIDGVFGNDTLLSVKAFQTNNKLTADGVVGKDTWSALIYLYSPLAICEPGANYHIVEKGDTLWSIARMHNTTVEELKRINNLTSDILSIGQKILLSSEATPPTTNVTYTVQKGDTLWSIARRFNTTVDVIKSYNNLTSNLLSVGQQLIIPGSSDIIIYTVQRGDTLWSIAQKHGMTVDDIKSLNNLTSNLISIGQQLKIRSS